MLEKPELDEQLITALLWEAYGIENAQVEFLPLGADVNTAVYRVVSRESTPYFLKLRKGSFKEISVLVPRFFHDQGLSQIIPPLKTTDGQLWTCLDAYTCILYPFIEGCNGFEDALSAEQWVEFGAALKRIHTLALPEELRGKVPSETYSPYWREMVREFQAQVEHSAFDEPVAAKLAAMMRMQRDEIDWLVERAEQLGNRLRTQALEQVLCHADIHAGNLLLSPGGSLFIVDWDDPILAPKERDLMFVGGGVGSIWNSDWEEALFYQGYGSTDIHRSALTYYRCERIVQDMAAFCQQLLLTRAGGGDREQGFEYFASNFLPNSVIEIARQTDQKLSGG